ncbi:hypothetical protein [Tropicimonas marinistellae]|uniref:hypothetical protein n=1 Tax=Tropicimonas marinistellae TaxID=1739787 RepID=UPI000834D7B9|nr:hypothetical protein [Tropicimonas marinistellae]
MRHMHNIVILLLIVCVLPWGAHAGSRVASIEAQLNAIRTEMSAESDAAGAIATVSPDTLKHCRKATLPGSYCGMDIGLPAARPLTVAPPRSVGPRPERGRAGNGSDPPGHLDPPRAL